MYTPIQIGLPYRFRDDVEYREYTPQKVSRQVVYCLWTLRTRRELAANFEYLVLPDGCIDIIFDIHSAPAFSDALVMSSGSSATALNLSRAFNYVGIRTQPGAWKQLPLRHMSEASHVTELGGQDLAEVHRSLVAAPGNHQEILESLAQKLLQSGLIGENPLVQHILQNPMRTVGEIMATSGYSRRQAQRIIMDTTGFTPHEFIRIVRFQKELATMKGESYADQSHFIRDFKRITNFTPGEFKTKYLF